MEYTRQDYIAGKCSHDEYYEQFVNDIILSIVDSFLKKLKNPELKDWDKLQLRKFIDIPKWRRLQCPQFLGTNKYSWSLSNNVCVAKAAAKLLNNKGE